MDKEMILERYNELRKSGLGEADCCRALMAQGVSMDDAAAATWAAAGQREPHRDDYQANARWYRGAERAYRGY